MAFIFGEEVYKPDEPELEGQAELIIAEQRNGPTGKVKLALVKRSTRFSRLRWTAWGRQSSGFAPHIRLHLASTPLWKACGSAGRFHFSLVRRIR